MSSGRWSDSVGRPSITWILPCFCVCFYDYTSPQITGNAIGTPLLHWVSYHVIEGCSSLNAFCSGGKYGFKSVVLKCRFSLCRAAVTLNHIKDWGGGAVESTSFSPHPLMKSGELSFMLFIFVTFKITSNLCYKFSPPWHIPHSSEWVKSCKTLPTFEKVVFFVQCWGKNTFGSIKYLLVNDSLKQRFSNQFSEKPQMVQTFLTFNENGGARFCPCILVHTMIMLCEWKSQ